VCFAVLIAAAWFATRQYVGVIQDSRLYTVQALSALQPGRFAGDLHFLYGSQDQFTVFSWLYAPALAFLGVSQAAISLTILCQFLWMLGLIYLAKGLFRDRDSTLFAVLMVIVLPGGVFF
jgi:hypothetical protein